MGLPSPQWIGQRAAERAEDADIQRALRTWEDSNASYAERVQAEQFLRDKDVPRLWQGRLPVKPGPSAKGETIIFYHGTQGKHLDAFKARGRIRAMGAEDTQDFGTAFYTTRRLNEAIGWAGDRCSLIPGERYVVALEVEKAKLDDLVGKTVEPFEYRWGVTPEEYRKGVRKTQAEIDAFNFSADYVYGPVSTAPSWEQFAFKSQRALDMLNTCPRSIYRISPEGQLELLRRIIP